MNILRRLLVGFSCVVAIGALQGAVALGLLNDLDSRVSDAIVRPAQQIDAARSAWQAFAAASLIVDEVRDPVRDFEPSELARRFTSNADQLSDKIAVLKSSSRSQEMRERIASAAQQAQEWRSAALALITDSNQTSIPAPHVMSELADGLKADLQSLVDLAHKDAGATRDAMASYVDLLMKGMIASILLAAAVGWAVAYRSATGLSRPLGAIEIRMRDLMTGDETAPVPHTDRTDEIGRIARTVEFMKAKLIERDQLVEEATARERETVCNSIGRSVSMLAATTREIAAATDDLAQRTDEQVQLLGETTTALDQITRSIETSADSAEQVRKMVLSANGEAARTNAVVQNAIRAMSSIEEASDKISRILGVIDEIAFQTNLLALNAGVEAARAGEAGRGFAVVATEVRALAQRSKDAALEVKSLVAHSTEQVCNGVTLVGDAGAAIDRIMSNVAEINVVVERIAAEAKDQAGQVRKFNQTVDSIERGTQLNATMVEENTAATKQLASGAEELQDLVADMSSGRPARTVEPRHQPQEFRQAA